MFYLFLQAAFMLLVHQKPAVCTLPEGPESPKFLQQISSNILYKPNNCNSVICNISEV